MPAFRLPNPASLTPEQRAEYRAAILGARYSQHRTDLAGGSCYYTTDLGPGRFVLHGFAGKALRPTFCESFRTIEARNLRIERFREKIEADTKRRRERHARPKP